MATTAYIILANSDSSITKRFRVLHGEYHKTVDKQQTVRRTITGAADVTMGALVERWQFVLKVNAYESDANYGNLANLKTFYEYNDPGATPTNVITLTDAEGNPAWSVYYTGGFDPVAQTPMLDSDTGSNAWYRVNATFEKTT